MSNSLKIVKYSFYDTFRSSWAILYFLFFLLITGGLFYFSADFSQSIPSLLNVILFIVPLVSIVFGTIYYYNSREFALLLMTQPMKRFQLFLGQYLGLSSSLALSFVAGTSVVFVFFGADPDAIPLLVMLLGSGIFLTFIFTAIAFAVSIHHDDRTKGFGVSILIWLFALVIYDGIFLVILFVFEDYPLENVAIAMTMLNPVDLSRIMVLLNLETAALMGYTGAVFNKFFGTTKGVLISVLVQVAWVILPLFIYLRKAKNKDF
ncbi:ABC transporter permease [Cytophagaceae bacterium ABcell3]|nr:ABC transporter permease [Cytophagaceae bacterium ABcell3]